jgi:hypothetical protein
MEQKEKIIGNLNIEVALQDKEGLLRKISIIIIVFECLIFILFQTLDVIYSSKIEDKTIFFLAKVQKNLHPSASFN